MRRTPYRSDFARYTEKAANRESPHPSPTDSTNDKTDREDRWGLAASKGAHPSPWLLHIALSERLTSPSMRFAIRDRPYVHFWRLYSQGLLQVMRI